MDEKTFGKLISDLSLYFERKPPTQATFQAWLPEVGQIPNSAYHLLLADVKNLETWPKNLPAFLRSKYAQIKESNGTDSLYKIHDRRFRPNLYAKPDCPKCQGKGLYDFHMEWPVAKENGKLITKHVVKPALCECTDAAEYRF